MAAVLPCLDLSKAFEPGTPEWITSCRNVRESLETHGCFLLIGVNDRTISVELREAMLASMGTLFDLPVETKRKNATHGPIYTYIGEEERAPLYETLAVMNADVPAAARSFTELMWPEGNENFCKTINSTSKEMLQLGGVLMRMVFEGYGIPERSRWESCMESSEGYFRMNKYLAPMREEQARGLRPHSDLNYLTLLSQNGVNGLMIKSRGGEWVQVSLPEGSMIVFAGQALRAWSNGRIYAPLHEVMVCGEKDRFSYGLFLLPKKNHIVEAPDELIDEEHPPLFKPFIYMDFLKYAYTTENNGENNLKMYAGV